MSLNGLWLPSIRFGKSLPVMYLLTTEEIRRFYMNWREEPVHRTWPFLWKKEIRLETPGGEFLSVNRLRSRLNFRVLKELCIKILPVHVYMSVRVLIDDKIISSAYL